jgi:Fanconi anemia group M protein
MKENLDFFEFSSTIDTMLVLYADVHEEQSGIPEILRSRGCQVEIKKLGIGDYLLSDRVCVERKTAGDFVNSIKTKRLFKQIAELKNNYEKPLFLIEGYHLYKVMGVYPAGIRGALAMITVAAGIPALFSKDKIDTAEFLITIARQEQMLGQKVSVHYKRKAASPAGELERILESFPGVGPTIAHELLVKYKTVGEVLSASVEELKTVPKIGDKKAKLLKEILNREYQPDKE